jgi:serralysin
MASDGEYDSFSDDSDGGAGTADMVDFGTSTSSIDVELFSNTILDDGLGGTGTIINVERVSGSDHNDRIIGSSNDDILIGSGGNDLLFGSQGNDFLVGGTGSDYLVGSQGFDIFSFDAADFEAGVFDTIIDFSETASSFDFIGFTGGLQQSDLIIAEFQGDVYITTNALNFSGGVAINDTTVAEVSDQLLFF